jgi:hypothetical protein
MLPTASRLVLFGSLVSLTAALSAQGDAVWVRGDVFAGSGTSTYRVYDNNGVFKETISSGGTSTETTGGAFDSAGNLWTTEFTSGQITQYDGNHPHAVIRRFNSQPGNESIVFNAANEFFSGSANGDRAMRKYDINGNLLETHNPTIGPRGTDWIDLAADQRTMFYTSEGPIVRRYDVVSRTQLPDFATGIGSINYALRLLPPFDGTGGLLVASTADIKRLNGAGAIVQTYDATGQNQWFAMNLDPDGTSFWGGDITTHNFYKFDIASGNILVGPINTTTQLAGLIVKGEITGGNTEPRCTAPAVIAGTTGNPLQFNVSAVDDNMGDIVTLSVSGLPAGAVMVPPLPLMGNPVASQFRWTPSAGQVGQFIVVFTARDRSGLESVCRTIINVAPDCLLMLSGDRSQIYLGNGDWCHVDPGQIFFATSVLANEVPTIGIPDDPRLKDVRIYGQILLYNEQNFPTDPLKMSNGLEMTLGGERGTAYGHPSGLWFRNIEPTRIGGRLTFEFNMN